MAQSLKPSLAASVDSHVLIDINSPNFRTGKNIKEDEIINSLRTSYLSNHFTESSDTSQKEPTSSSYVTALDRIPSNNIELDPNLQKSGGDITREIYRFASSNEPQKMKLAKSLEDVTLSSESRRRESSASGIRIPGGFRREFIVNKIRQGHHQVELKTKDGSASSRDLFYGLNNLENAISDDDNISNIDKVPFLTRNFLEFLYLYGHFAGESFEDDFLPEDEGGFVDERTSLLPSQSRLSRKAIASARGTASDSKTFLLLLKSFIGTGVLFLPGAFHNGGLTFSICMLLFFGIYSYWCYIILTKAKVVTGVSSFGDIGLKLYGPWMKAIILFSLVVTQIGFSAAYMIFTAKNLSPFVENFLRIPDLDLAYLMGLQLLVFIPLSFVRKVSKLSFPSLLANSFIMFGLLIVLFFVNKHLFIDLGMRPADGVILGVNYERWTLFVGTAIFSFEGIGLIIPIQDSMKNPEKFPLVLGLVLITATILFISIATIGYLSYGSSIDVVILLNLPQSNIFVNLIQLFYSLAIMLSTPLQMFPAIKIIESKLFPKFIKVYAKDGNSPGSYELSLNSGKLNWKVKWLKNFVRSIIVTLVVLIAYLEVENLDKVVSIIGSLACIPLVYIYPPLLHLRSHSIPFSVNQKVKWRVLFDYLLVGFGTVSMFYTSYQSIFSN